jgi:fructose-1,6-bisphosphatase I
MPSGHLLILNPPRARRMAAVAPAVALRRDGRGCFGTPAGSSRRASRAPLVVRASSTNTAKAKAKSSVLGTTFTNWLLNEEKHGRIDADMAVLLSSISVACKKISAAVRTDYYKQDVDLPKRANELFKDAMVGCGRTGVIASAANDQPPFAVEESFAGNRVVVFDPLDGVTNVDAAVCTGSIFGVYQGKSECVPDWSKDGNNESIDQACVANACNPGKNLQAAGYCMYSSSTILMLTVGDGVFGFTYDPSVGEFINSHERVTIPKRGKIYSINEGNRDGWSVGVKNWVDALKNGGPDANGKPYSARYIGSLVADVHRTLLYGGVCAQTASSQNPEGRLRLLTEAGPMAFVAEQVRNFPNHHIPSTDYCSVRST